MIKLKVNGKGRLFDGDPEMPLLFGILSQTPPKCIGSTPATADKVGRTRAATDSARDCEHGFTVTGERIRTMPMTKRSVSFA